MNCKHCGTTMLNPHPNRRFCSAECRDTHRLEHGPRCSVEDCGKVIVGRRLCAEHYAKARNSGAFTDKRCKVDGCTGPDTSRGYCQSHYSRATWNGEYGPERERREKDRHRLKLYGLGLADIDRMREDQGDRCAICTSPLGRAHVDHDHATGKVRALLCHHCNIGLGHFRDDPARLAAAIDYLAHHSADAADARRAS